MVIYAFEKAELYFNFYKLDLRKLFASQTV